MVIETGPYKRCRDQMEPRQAGRVGASTVFVDEYFIPGDTYEHPIHVYVLVLMCLVVFYIGGVFSLPLFFIGIVFLPVISPN